MGLAHGKNTGWKHAGRDRRIARHGLAHKRPSLINPRHPTVNLKPNLSLNFEGRRIQGFRENYHDVNAPFPSKAHLEVRVWLNRVIESHGYIYRVTFIGLR